MADPGSAASDTDIEASVGDPLVGDSLVVVEVLAARTRRSTAIVLDMGDNESLIKIAAAASVSAEVPPSRPRADEVDAPTTPEHAELNPKSETLKPAAVKLIGGREGQSHQRSRADVDGSGRSPDLVVPQPSGVSSGSACGASSGSACCACSVAACGAAATPDQLQLFTQKLRARGSYNPKRSLRDPGENGGLPNWRKSVLLARGCVHT
jgi:hypothetical protein